MEEFLDAFSDIEHNMPNYNTKYVRNYLKEFHQKFEDNELDLYNFGLEDNPSIWFDIYDDTKIYSSLDKSLWLNSYPRKCSRIGNQ